MPDYSITVKTYRKEFLDNIMETTISADITAPNKEAALQIFYKGENNQ